MVLRKRLRYGFNGYEVPAMPQASRSVRRRRLFDKKVESNQMCAFDLLATLAGELREKESSTAVENATAAKSGPANRNEVINEEPGGGHFVKPEPWDQGSCDESASVCALHYQRRSNNHSSKEFHVKEGSKLEPDSIITKSNRPEESITVEESKRDDEFYSCMICRSSHYERGCNDCRGSCDGKVKYEIDRQKKVKEPSTECLIDEDTHHHLKDSADLDPKPPALVSSDSSSELPSYAMHNYQGSFDRDDIKVVSRDDDENSSVCTQTCTSTSKSYRLPNLGERRIRKLRAYKHWKGFPAIVRDDRPSNTDSETKSLVQSWKASYAHQKSQRSSFKRRKLIERSLVTKSGGISSKVVSSFPNEVTNGGKNGQGGVTHQASIDSITLPKSSLESRDSYVQLKIERFTVPELLIEIPETATVGSLKRTVMDAVTAVYGGGLRVGVHLHGKKLRDDNKTLVQTGIFSDNEMDNLGFTLEPKTEHSPQSQLSECPHSFPCDATQPLTRFPAVPVLDPSVPETLPLPPEADSSNSLQNFRDSNESNPSSAEMSSLKTPRQSKALVAIPATSAEALALVPSHSKSRQPEHVQRRIRRPFSVTEVEALVQAVEQLGTGRWRDVKLRAFENAKHRTYVDLKDKWKTLVHTARISPQQRRGEPVPQELLDRVLSAHAYWSQQNSKPGSKPNQWQPARDLPACSSN